MNDDYLWDKTGQPDPEVEELEQILGTLRYQPRELEIPADIRPQRRSYVTRGLAIAAVIALVVLGLGVWRATRSVKPAMLAGNQPNKVENAEKTPVKETSPPKVEQIKPAAQPESVVRPTPRPRSGSVARRNRPLKVVPPKLSESELAEAEAAKDQVMLALRVASTKLNEARRKTQGNNEIHNQHRTG